VVVLLTETSQKTTQIIAADDDPLFRVIGIIELPHPIFIGNNAAEDSLIISKQNESHETACRDGNLKRFAPSKPGAHYV
jgi:hypothetical protein